MTRDSLLSRIHSVPPSTTPNPVPSTSAAVPSGVAPTPVGSPAPAPTPPTKGVYVRRAIPGGDALTSSSLSTLNASNSTGTSTGTPVVKAVYERPAGLIVSSAAKRTKPAKAKGVLPLSPEEKSERLPSKIHTLFPIDFPTPEAVPHSTMFSPPTYSANPSKSLPDQPDEKASWGFWPSPPPLKAGKAVFPAPQVVLDPITNEPTTDPRPRTDIFIDNSNVFYSFLNWVRARKDAKVIQKMYKGEVNGKGRSVKILTLAGKKVRMDYEVLFGLLERGRKVERRVLVGSSPMWQSLEPAVNWVSRSFSLSLSQPNGN